MVGRRDRRERREAADREAAQRAGEASAAAATTVDGDLATAAAVDDGAAARDAGAAAAAAAETTGPTLPHVPPDLTAAAFFDVDNTMMMGASIFHFARGLASRSFFSGADLRGFVWQQVKFRLGGEGSPEDIRVHREAALSFVAGREVSEVVELGEEVYDGVYTGRLVGELLHGPAKAHAVRALAAREGLDLRRCSAYSDSINDAPMLSVVGTAVAVNPDAELRGLARRNSWEIRDFRSGRKVARIGVPSVLGAGAVAGAVAAGAAYSRRRSSLF